MGNDSNVGVASLSIALLLALLIFAAGETTATEDLSPAPEIRVTLLGTGVPVPNTRQFGQSILVEVGETRLLFDCGRGCAHRLWNLDHDHLRETHHLFLTHMHSDHTVGVPDLYMNGWNLGRQENLRVYGPAVAGEFMKHLRLAFEEDVVFRADLQNHAVTRDTLEYVAIEVKDGMSFEVGDVKVTAIEVDHSVIKPAFGYRVDAGDFSVVISGDTTFSENLIRLGKGADVVIHEVFSPAIVRFVRDAFPQDVADDFVALHTLAPEVGRVFTKIQPRLGVFTHLDNNPAGIPELIEKTRTTWDGALEVGEDLMVIEIGETIRVLRPSSEQ